MFLATTAFVWTYSSLGLLDDLGPGQPNLAGVARPQAVSPARL
jgi:hypothetical protein